MAHYIVLGNFTEQGIKTVKDTVKRADAFKEMARKRGVNVHSVYWTLGRYDVVAICESKDERAMTALGLSMGMLGNVKTETLTAFDSAEMTKVLEGVG
jgi:uncharacterized protein with GYD domain